MSPALPANPVSAETVQSRVYGTLFFIGFGTLWLLTGLANMHRFTPAPVFAIVSLSIAAVASGLFLLRLASHLPSRAQTPVDALREKRIFNAVNIIQWVAVATAVAVLVLLRLPEYIVPAIGIIVGLHLYPLAGAFRYPLHYVTGTLLVSWCSACIAMVPRDRLPGIGAFGTGAILLGSAVFTLLLAYSSARSFRGHHASVRHA